MFITTSIIDIFYQYFHKPKELPGTDPKVPDFQAKFHLPSWGILEHSVGNSLTQIPMTKKKKPFYFMLSRVANNFFELFEQHYHILISNKIFSRDIFRISKSKKLACEIKLFFFSKFQIHFLQLDIALQYLKQD